MKLSDFDEEQSNSGMERTFTDPDTGAWVKISVDDTGHPNPIKDYAEGVEIAYVGYDSERRIGTVDGIRYPDECKISCGHCEGSGDDPDRWEVHLGRYGNDGKVASGSESAMDFTVERYHARGLDAIAYHAPCPVCKGECEITVSLDRYLREEHGAIFSYRSSTGGYSQGDDAEFVVIITEDPGYEDIETAAKAWADEYASWARGDIYAIESSLGGDECYGFIGDDHAEQAALMDFLVPAIADRKKRRDENVVLGYN